MRDPGLWLLGKSTIVPVGAAVADSDVVGTALLSVGCNVEIDERGREVSAEVDCVRG